MRKTLLFFVPLAAAILLGGGCVNAEKKAGRGIANTLEIVRLGEFQRSIEQEGIMNGVDDGVWTGVVQGASRSVVRTGVGIYEVVTAPIPPYHPVLTNYITAKPGYPDAYRPRLWDAAIFDTDHSLGFSGGDVAPWFPGSRFRVFDN